MSPSGGCALASRHADEDPAGTATPFDALVLLQLPPPWPRVALQDPRVPTGVREALTAAAARGQRAYALLVDGAAPAPGGDQVRVSAWRRVPGPPAYAGAATVVPGGRTGEAVAAGLAGEPLPGATEAVAERELLVCTHGERDHCCGRFGETAFRALQGAPAGARVWRVSHFGGHRFAPTLLDLPEGRAWGRLSGPALAALARRDRPAAELRACYRGWCALPSAHQAAERDAFLAHGWAWRDARVVAHEDETGRLVLDARWADGRAWRGAARLTRDAPGPAVPASCGAEPRPRPGVRVVWESSASPLAAR